MSKGNYALGGRSSEYGGHSGYGGGGYGGGGYASSGYGHQASGHYKSQCPGIPIALLLITLAGIGTLSDTQHRSHLFSHIFSTNYILKFTFFFDLNLQFS